MPIVKVWNGTEWVEPGLNNGVATLLGTETLLNKTLITPNIVAATGTSLSVSGALSSTNGTVSGTVVSSSGAISTSTGTISGAHLVSSGSIVTSTGTISGAHLISSGSIVTSTGTVSGAHLISSGSISTTTGTISGAHITSSGSIVATGTVSAATLNATGNVTITGTVSAAALGSSLLSTATPGILSSLGTYGVSTIPARSDHQHPVGTTKLSVFGTTSSSELAGIITDETGSGALVFATGGTLTSPILTTPVITQATSTPSFSSNVYTLALTDAGQMLLASNSTNAGTVRINTDANVNFTVGSQIHIIQTGTGQLTIVATTPATTSILSAGATAASPKLRAQYSAATMLKTATDTWYVFGDIA